MRKLLIVMAGLGLIITNSASADTLGARLSGGMFKYSVSGNLRDNTTSTDSFDIKNDLGWKDDKGFMGYIYFEHPIPVIPNIRLGRTSLDLGGIGTISRTVVYNGRTYTANDTVTSKLDLSHTEIALYYEIIDTGIDLDLGLNFKLLDGKASLDGASSGSTSTEFKETVPMLYGALNIPIPGTGFSVAGDLSTISYKDSTFTDYLVRVRYDTDFALGVELGYRSLNIDYQDKDAGEYAKVDAKGPYLMATLSF